MTSRLLLLFVALAAGNLVCAEEADTLSLHEVVVTGTRTPASERAITPTITAIDKRQLSQLERVSVLPTLTELVPNLFVTQRGVMGYGVSGGAAGAISVRGLSGGTGQVMVLVDGHPQYQGIFGHPISDAYHTMLAERIEVVRGPASVLYGSNAMGGVVNIITKQGLTGGFGAGEDAVNTSINIGAGSYNSLQAEVANSVRKGRWFSDVALNYQRSDNHRADMGFYQYGGLAKVGFDFSSHWRAWGALNLTHFAASNPGPVSASLLDARQWINRGVVEAVVENRYGRTSGAVSVYHNFGRHKVNDGHVASAAARDYLFRSKDALTGVSAHQGFGLWQGSWITLGFDYQNIHGEAWNADIVTNERLNRKMEQNMHYPLDKDLTEVAGYVNVRQDIASWWTVEAGVRYDNHSEAGGEWIPQGGFVFRPLQNGELKLTAGKGFRVPNLKEMYLYGVANPDLEPERLWNYEAAWKQRIAGGRFTYGINIFYMKADNLIGTMMVESLGRNANYNTGETEHYGGELEAAFRVNSHWSLTTNHSYLHTQKAILAAPEYKGYLGAQYRVQGLELNAGLQHVSGLCTDIADDAKENFTLLSLGAAYRLLPQVKLWVRGENLLAQKYEINKGFPMPKATFMSGVRVTF